MPAPPPSRATIDLAAFAHNVHTVQQIAGPQRAIIAVLKADAYGHGIFPVARKATECGARMLGVATVPEGVAMREAGIEAPVLVMMQPDRDAFPAVLEHRLTLMIADRGAAERLDRLGARAGKIVPIHCMIDTGMNRQGFHIDEALDELAAIARLTHVDIEGIATHFPNADRVADAFTGHQIAAFAALRARLSAQGVPFSMAHAANSPGLIHYPESRFDAVRPGLILHGVWLNRTRPASLNELRPVMRWQSHVTQVRELSPGDTVGYGRTFTAAKPMQMAVLPVGYADGYPHHLSNNADVLLHGERCPLLGTVSMDQIVVDVTHLPDIAPGDVATLIGSDGVNTITVEEIADRAGTVPYEILTSIGNRVAREFVDNEDIVPPTEGRIGADAAS